jgi:diacylglycerol kinase
MKSPSLIASFRFAFTGIAHAFRTQRNMQVHALITAVVIAVGVALQISMFEWAVLAVTIGLVFQAELMNTALEAIVDKASPERHPLAGVAKDCAAGAVFVAACAAVVVGVLIFAPRVLGLLR